MSFTFRTSDFRKIGKVLECAPRMKGTMHRFEVGTDPQRKLALEIYSYIRIGTKRGNLVSVYTASAHLQLHFCTAYVVSEMMGEVTFIGEHEGKLTGLIVEKQGGCSLYANVDRSILSGDFTQLGPEVMLSGIALSLTDTFIDTPVKKPARRKAASGKRKAAVR